MYCTYLPASYNKPSHCHVLSHASSFDVLQVGGMPIHMSHAIDRCAEILLMKAIWKCWVPRPRIEPRPPAHQANDLTTRPPSFQWWKVWWSHNTHRKWNEMDISLTSHINPCGFYRDILRWMTWSQMCKLMGTSKGLNSKWPVTVRRYRSALYIHTLIFFECTQNG